MIGFTLPEIRRLLTKLVLRVVDAADHVWAWSRFRRRRQHQARLSHYNRRGYPLTQMPLQYQTDHGKLHNFATILFAAFDIGSGR